MSRDGLRCAFCHDRVGFEGLSCGACWTRLHHGCVAELGRCPTLGCAGGAWQPLPRVRWADLVREAEPWLALGDALRSSEAWGVPGPCVDGGPPPLPGGGSGSGSRAA